MKNQTKTLRVYYYSLLGALGGLTGWFVQALLFRGIDDITLGTLIGRGTLLGGLIGVCIAAYDGIISRSPKRFGLLALWGLFFGVVAGGIALPVSQALFSRLWPAQEIAAGVTTPRSLLVGMFCWTIFGAILGFVEVIFKGTQAYKGLLGGLIGGLIGGLMYETARFMGQTESGNPPQQVQAASLLVMGAAVGFFISLIATMLRRAWVEVLDGKFAGHEYDVTKYVSRERGGRGVRGVIGSDELRANVFLPADNEILAQHAILCYENEAPTLLVTPEAKKIQARTLINGQAVANNCPLTNGDEIQIGTTNLRYHQSRKAYTA